MSYGKCNTFCMQMGGNKDTVTFGLEGVGVVGFYCQSVQDEGLLTQPSKSMCSSGFTGKDVLIKILLRETT